MDFPPSISSPSSRSRSSLAVGALALAVVTLGCGGEGEAAPEAAAVVQSTTTTAASATVADDASSSTAAIEETSTNSSSTTAPTTTSTSTSTSTTTTTTEPVEIRAFNGRAIPVTVDSAQNAAALFGEVTTALQVDGQSTETYADLGHTQQLVIRKLMRNKEWIETFRSELPAELLPMADLHIKARSELGMLHSGWTPTDNIPAWAIIEPEPLDVLVGHYKSASTQTGIDWQVLAGINLIETGMGRIDGLSSAGAQGPMQFLPTTWVEVSEGGDVTDPEDAIHGAARYLVRRGGLDDIRKGLWGYNNSDHYVNAVLAYAEMITLDERALRGFYNWEIYVGSAEGTLWLPVGFSSPEVSSAKAYLAENPWAKTLD